ncbi:MAG TPA: glycine C-acetyltransferase [Polyangiaceae bacterium LLY-WYZ-15_(1-7)]|nr:glycine C-acetyltransferase [Myxococcales bacterium]MAT29622.1 glycine C-acetyltransferase [Sandaracinus sp.]HJK93556.1 glycine C-acetyltransferase [Polyangiaceae bacterium LLY-WYZ-15_(1-7)]MBJ73668.1 glycine C-acetyltransferase [Sandaracinus sp.]HJL04502.1 glycine C-acetyltransferase [Polyangiaceae bacterium LLY-WYZ-15_(1-7)]
MHQPFLDHLAKETAALRDEGLFKEERVITSHQDAAIQVGDDGQEVINLCANNYLGLANHPRLLEAAKKAIDDHGYGMASVRFICGTQDVHKELEARISRFLGTDDTILYAACFDANGGFFETCFGPEDAIISDALNHASIIDGIRLCKAQRFRYANNDMDDLRAKLEEAKDARFKVIATDAVFSMDGYYANLPAICDLADEYGAITFVDDCHGVGFVGETGAGTHEKLGVKGRVDVITGTLGKALGGASGGYTAGRKEIVAWLRQRSRPYLFSNTLAPVIAATSIEVLNLLESEGAKLRAKLWENAAYFREKMEAAGFELLPGDHAIIPVMLGDAKLASRMADLLLERGIYVIGFSYPVVPKGQARIRTQMSAGLERAHLDRAIDAFIAVGKELEVIS